MAQTCTGMLDVIYDVHIDDYAAEYANMVAGSKGANLMFGNPYDEEKWQAEFDRFKAYFDTPEKLMRWAEALHEAGA